MSTSPGETTPDAPAPLPISPGPATGPGENTTPAAGTQQDTPALSAADQDAVAAAEKKAARKATKAAQKAAVERARPLRHQLFNCRRPCDQPPSGNADQAVQSCYRGCAAPQLLRRVGRANHHKLFIYLFTRLMNSFFIYIQLFIYPPPFFSAPPHSSCR